MNIKKNITQKIVIINGPNLNMLGVREKHIYGTYNLNDLKNFLNIKKKNLNVLLYFYQSNSECDIINKIHLSYQQKVSFIIINPGAFGHTSIAIRDAFLSTNIPFIEVHITNIFSREKIRNKSYLSDISKGFICGLGFYGYYYALLEIKKNINM